MASLHFNEKIHRETQVSKEGKDYICVTYPKFKLGKEVVREVTRPPTYYYVDTLRKLLFTLPKSELNKTRARYTVRAPEPLNRQFPRRVSKEEVVRGYEARKQMKKTVLFPSEAEQPSLQPASVPSDSTPSTSSQGKRRPYNCSICKKPLRLHKTRCKK